MDATAIVKTLIVPNQNQTFVIQRLFANAFCSSTLQPVYLFFADGYGTLICWIFIVSCALLPPSSVARGLGVKKNRSCGLEQDEN